MVVFKRRISEATCSTVCMPGGAPRTLGVPWLAFLDLVGSFLLLRNYIREVIFFRYLKVDGFRCRKTSSWIPPLKSGKKQFWCWKREIFCLTKTSKTFISRGHTNNEPLSFQCKSELFELQLAKVFLFGHGCKVSTEEPPVLPGSFCLQGWMLWHQRLTSRGSIQISQDSYSLLRIWLQQWGYKKRTR